VKEVAPLCGEGEEEEFCLWDGEFIMIATVRYLPPPLPHSPKPSQFLMYTDVTRTAFFNAFMCDAIEAGNVIHLIMSMAIPRLNDTVRIDR
jgi:hypothetical protein